ncbi:MAG: DUF4040 domain-containing protein [Marinilabiliaceae bacterium]|nr:DUF4040 domain-containing protein [Marinilabiliaceae bacterium]
MELLQYLPYLLLVLIGGGVAAPVLTKRLKHWVGVVLAFIPLLFFILFVRTNIILPETESFVVKVPWGLIPGGDFSFRVDGLSLIFGLLVSGIGVLVLLYSAGYMKKSEHKGRFFLLLSLFMAAMLGLVLSENLIGLFVFWELTSVISFLLIGFDNHLAKARKAALQAFLLTALGGLSLLFAIILIGNVAGTYNISELLDKGALLTAHKYYPLIFILMVVGVFTKSAQFPLHFWLPGAMNAPTPVSAYLHSATMVNAGVFLLLRFNPFLGNTMLWKSVLPLFGAITMFVGAVLSFGEKDMKRILAFTTISALGTMVLLAGIDTDASMEAALVFFVVHGLYKGALFMITGLIDKATGTRDIRKLGHLWKKLGWVSWATLIALLSMAGLPPMLGFIGKELIYTANMQAPYFPVIIMVLGVASNAMMVGVSFYLFYNLFWSKRKLAAPCEVNHTYSRSALLSFGPVFLSAFSLALGLAPDRMANYLTNAIYFIRAKHMELHLTLWHGFNMVLMLSMVTVSLGILLYIYRDKVSARIAIFSHWLNTNYYFPDLFDEGIFRYVRFASKNTDRIQHGYHRFYLITFFLVTTLFISAGLFYMTGTNINLDFSNVKWYIVLLLMVMAFGAFYAVASKSYLSAILALGVVGFGIGLLYMFYGAVDLAITQFLVETLIMVIFVLVIYHLPGYTEISSRRTRFRDAIIAALVGLFVTFIVLMARFVNLNEPISDYLILNSLDLAKGRNVVNVILVDFRALDTLGEITVLALAAGGVVALLRSNRSNKENVKSK